MRVLENTAEVRQRYQNLLEASTAASVYHTIDWLQVFESLACDLAFVEVDGSTIVPFVCKGRGVLRRAFSLPYDTYGGAVAASGDTVSYDEVIRALDIPSARIVDFAAKTNGTSCVVEHATAHIVELDDDYDRVAGRYAAMNRRAIRQADKRGVEVRLIKDAEEISTFYRFYHQSALKYGGQPLPVKFFQSIYDLMVPKDMARFYLASCDGRAVAANLILRYKGKACDWTWGYDADRLHLRPTNALIDQAIRDEIACGSVELNLGASPPGSNGNAQFKTNFGARTHSYKILSKVGFYYHAARSLKHRASRRPIPANGPK